LDTSIVVAGIAAGVSLGTAGLTYRAAASANKANSRKVDMEEHREALERLRKIIEEQDKHVERVRSQLDRVQEQLAREQDVSMALRAQIRSLQEQVDDLMRSRARLEDMITATALPVRREKGTSE
jgi:peptidoglycan hydrolase CwlO-like protein